MTITKQPLIVGLTGCSGSGKSVFLEKASQGFSAEEVCVVSQDNYYMSRDQQPRDRDGVRNFDLPQSIDHKRFEMDLRRLQNGEIVSLKEYTYNNPASQAGVIKLYPAKIILVEGIFIYHIPEINELFDYRIFIEAREYLMLKRRIIRDQKERGYDLAEVLYRFENHVIPAYDHYIHPYRDRCDIVILNNKGFDRAVEIVRGFLLSRLA